MADMRPKSVRLKFPHSANVYDVRQKRYRGFTDTLDDVIYPAQAELFALLPYEVTGLQLKAVLDNSDLNFEAMIDKSPGAAPVTHVFRYTVIDPSGRVHREMCGNDIAFQGRLDKSVFLGYSAAPGWWRLCVLDIVSGPSQEVVFEVSPSSRTISHSEEV